MNQILELRVSAERRLVLDAGGIPGSDISLVLADRGLGGESSTDGWASPPPSGIPPAPAPPPPPPPLGAISQRTVKPTKPAIKPRVKMRPLFWNRIILDHEEDDVKEGAFVAPSDGLCKTMVLFCHCHCHREKWPWDLMFVFV